jgi:hypothetical protein
VPEILKRTLKHQNVPLNHQNDTLNHQNQQNVEKTLKKGPKTSATQKSESTSENSTKKHRTSQNSTLQHQNGALNHQNTQNMMKHMILNCQVRQNGVFNCMTR